MALREGECFLVRRFADRGISKNIGDSRVCGDRFNRDRRSAGRGNEIGNRDPQDIIKIERLRQRVRDLEEIRRLRQRVRDLELQRERRVKETESGNIVWDVVNEEEEHPFDHPHHRFHEPLFYQEGLSEDKPIFDEDGIDCGEEECLFVQMVLNGYTDKETVGNHHEHGEVSPGTFNFSYKNAVVNGGALVVDGCETVLLPVILDGGAIIREVSQSRLETPSLAEDVCDLNKDIEILGFQSGTGIHGDDNFTIPIINEGFMADEPICPEIKNGKDLVKTGVCMDSLHVKTAYGLIEKEKFKDKRILVYRDELASKNLECMDDIPRGSIIHIGFLVESDASHVVVVEILPKFTNNLNPQHMLHVNNGSDALSLDGTQNATLMKKVGAELLKKVKSIVHNNRVDVPFDPGGVGPMTKLEDEFFFEEGEYDAGIYKFD